MTFHSDHFGPLTVDQASTVEFPVGIPGFEDCRRFTVLRHPEHQDLVFVQSLERPALCFLTMPVEGLRRDYRLVIADEDRDLIGLPNEESPLVLAILSLVEGEEPTANLRSPVVIHPQTRKAVQAIRPDTLYSFREPLAVEVVPCS